MFMQGNFFQSNLKFASKSDLHLQLVILNDGIFDKYFSF